MKNLVCTLPLLLASAAVADVGVVEATGAFQLGGSSTTTYVSGTGASQNPRLNGYDFGTVNTLAGQTLALQNWFFENYAYNGGATPLLASTNNNWLDSSNTAGVMITIYANGSAVSTRKLQLVQTGNSGNNRFWQLTGSAQGTNIAAGLANGAYTAEFFTAFNANQWTGSVSMFDAFSTTSVASFTVVPAPGAVALVGLAGLVARRRR